MPALVNNKQLGPEGKATDIHSLLFRVTSVNSDTTYSHGVVVFLPCWARGIPGKHRRPLLHCCKLLHSQCGDNPHLGHISLLLSPVITNRLPSTTSGKEHNGNKLLRNTAKVQSYRSPSRIGKSALWHSLCEQRARC